MTVLKCGDPGVFIFVQILKCCYLDRRSDTCRISKCRCRNRWLLVLRSSPGSLQHCVTIPNLVPQGPFCFTLYQYGSIQKIGESTFRSSRKTCINFSICLNHGNQNPITKILSLPYLWNFGKMACISYLNQSFSSRGPMYANYMHTTW